MKKKKHLGLTQLRLVRWWVRLRNMQVFFLDLEFNLNLSLFALIATNLIDLHNVNWWILTFVVVTFYVTIDISSQSNILTIKINGHWHLFWGQFLWQLIYHPLVTSWQWQLMDIDTCLWDNWYIIPKSHLDNWRSGSPERIRLALAQAGHRRWQEVDV